MKVYPQAPKAAHSRSPRCGPDELASLLRVLFASAVNLMMAKVKAYDSTNREVLLNTFRMGSGVEDVEAGGEVWRDRFAASRMEKR